MNSGIYKLTFSSGHFYIGKSGNISRRWDDHWDNFAKNKAARNMQLAFNKFGYPHKEIILSCHPDHCDIMEAFLIKHLNSSLMINATKPTCTITEAEYVLFLQHPEVLESSTASHCQTMISQARKILDISANFAKQVALLEKDQEFIINDMLSEIRAVKRGTLIPELENRLAQLRLTVAVAEDKIAYLESRNWWQRLFNK